MNATSLRDTILSAVGDRLTPEQLGPLLVELFFSSRLHLVEKQWAGQPFILADFQQQFVRDLFGTFHKTPEGILERLYTEALLGFPRVHAKTTLVAGLALYFMAMEPVPGQIIASVAVDKDQARKALGYGQRMVERDEFLSLLTQGKTYKDAIYFPELDAVWKVFPHNAGDLQGEHARIAICDEPHEYRNPDVIEALRSGMAGEQEPMLLGITTAGKKRAGVLWEWIKQIREDPRGLLKWHGAADGADPHDPATWRAANPAPWVTDAYLESQHRRMPLPSFERYHLNRFPIGKDAGRAFEPRDVQACQVDPEPDDDAPWIITGDGAMKDDHMAVLAVQRLEDGTLNVEAWIWTESNIDSETGRYNVREAEDLIVELYRTRSVARVALDPAKWWRSMEVLDQDYGIPVEEFPQSDQRMCPASQALLDELREHRLRLGSNPLLAEHLLNATVVEKPARGWRIGKASNDEKIDASIALAIGVYLAVAEGGRTSYVTAADIIA